MCSNTQKRVSRCSNGITLRTPPAPMMTISPGSMSRSNSAPMMSSAQVSEARIHDWPSRPRTKDPCRADPSENQRPHPERVAYPDDLVLRESHEGIGALDLAQRIGQP